MHVPTAFLMSPVLCGSNENNCSKSLLYWLIGRQISKAIDSKGINWNFDGTIIDQLHAKSDPLGATKICLSSHIKRENFADIEHVVNEAIGIELALKIFAQQKISSENIKLHKEGFFKSLQPFYCSNEHLGSVMVLLEKYMDYLMKRENTFDCSFHQINMNCPLWM
uniref:Uncharacterized protein n=1 Tax=Acrobeloides nanus TaxID=290746 RepID=A0A914CXU1_9BILA